MIALSGSCTLQSNRGRHADIDTIIEDFEDRFRCLQNGMFRELVTSSIDTSSFLNTITLLPEKLKKEYEEAIVDMLPTLSRQESISQLFYHLNFLISFIDYGLLEYIIKIFGSDILKADMRSYVSDMRMFMEQTTIQQLINCSYLTGQRKPPPNFTILRKKIGKDACSCTLAKINKLRLRFSAEAKLSHIIFHLITLEDSNSFIVSFLVPSALVPSIMKSAKKLSNKFFQREKIISISVGNRWLYNPKLVSFCTELKQQYKKYKLTASQMETVLLPTQKVFRIRLMRRRSMQHGKMSDRSEVDQASNAEIEIEVKDVFKSTHLGSEIILVEGSSCSGKSTLAVHSCQKWGEGELFEEFTLVILVQLGDPAVQRAQSISDLLPCHNVAVAQTLATELEATNGRGVLWILDGWDELPPKLRQDSIFHQLMPPKPDDVHRQFAPQTGESQSPILHTQHYSLGMLCESSFIITSRPISSGDLHLVVSSRIELVGFSPEEQRQYFTECLEGDAEALEDLLEKIQDNLIVQSSCYIPLNAALTLYYFKCKGHSLPNTEYELFATIIFSCIKHHLEQEGKGQDLPVELKSLDDLLSSRAVGEHVERLCELAYNGVMQHKVTFSPSDLPQGSRTLGLLSQIVSFLEGGKSVYYRFFHHSLLEALAAMHIATCLSDSEQASQFQRLFDQPHFVDVFRFYSAITKLKTPGMDEVVKKMNSESQLVQLLRCLYEAQDITFCHFVAKYVRRLSLSGTSLSPLDCLSIGYFISMSSSDVRRVANLGHCQVGDNGVKHLTKFMCENSSLISHTQKTTPSKTSSSGWTLFLYSNDIHEDGAASIAKVLHSRSCVITILNLDWNPVGSKGLQFISEALITNTSLIELMLRHCSLVISDENGPVVTEMLHKNRSLKGLSLSDNKGIMLSDTGLSYIAEGLKRNNSLKQLIMSDITALGGKSLATAIATNSCSALIELDINDLEITKDSGPAFVDMLQQNCSLERISFDYSHRLSDVGVSFIAEGLQKNTTLKSMSLCDCNITPCGAKCLAEMLMVNSSLIYLHIAQNPIRDEGVAHLAEALEKNKTLRSLSMNSCEITNAGVASLTDSLHLNRSLMDLTLYENRALTKEGVKPLLDVASRRSVTVHFEHKFPKHSSSLQKSTNPGAEETSK